MEVQASLESGPWDSQTQEQEAHILQEGHWEW